MNIADGTVALQTLVSITGLWVLLFWLYRDYCVDRFRQEMFTLRDELFDKAPAMGISYDHPAYAVLRMTMNGFIRFGHRMTLPGTFVFLGMRDRKDLEWQQGAYLDGWMSVTGQLTQPQRAFCNQYLQRINMLAFKHMVYGSPIFVLTVIAPILMVVLLQAGLVSFGGFLKKPIAQLDLAAVSYGND